MGLGLRIPGLLCPCRVKQLARRLQSSKTQISSFRNDILHNILIYCLYIIGQEPWFAGIFWTCDGLRSLSSGAHVVPICDVHQGWGVRFTRMKRQSLRKQLLAQQHPAYQHSCQSQAATSLPHRACFLCDWVIGQGEAIGPCFGEGHKQQSLFVAIAYTIFLIVEREGVL